MAAKRDEAATVNITLRIKETLRESLEESAKARGVSLNAELAARLEYARDRLGLTMEVMTLAFGREVASILVLLGAVMHAEGLTRAGIDWANDNDAYTAAVDYAMAALAALRPGAAPPKHLDEETWTHAASMVDKLAGTNLTNHVSNLINEYTIERRDHNALKRRRK
jgi:hypothetical protein